MFHFVPVSHKGLITNGAKDVLNMENMAHDFWERVSADERISDELREFLSRGNPIDLMMDRADGKLL